MKHITLSIILVAALSGCSEVNDLGNKIVHAYPTATPKLVFGPGYPMKVGGEIAPVFGNEECPAADKYMRLFFGPNPDEGQFSCIVISSTTKEVLVTVGLKQGASREYWTVERSGERVMLRRADGSYLASAN